MGSRHRRHALASTRGDEVLLRPSKELRAKEHRRVRHRASQQLHTVEDPEDEVVVRPKFDRPPRVKTQTSRRKRHWKLKAWKRRTLERQRRNLERERLLQEAA